MVTLLFRQVDRRSVGRTDERGYLRYSRALLAVRRGRIQQDVLFPRPLSGGDTCSPCIGRTGLLRTLFYKDNPRHDDHTTCRSLCCGRLSPGGLSSAADLCWYRGGEIVVRQKSGGTGLVGVAKPLRAKRCGPSKAQDCSSREIFSHIIKDCDPCRRLSLGPSSHPTFCTWQ